MFTRISKSFRRKKKLKFLIKVKNLRKKENSTVLLGIKI